MNLKDEYGTPLYIYQAMDNLFNFDLDVCASSVNAKCAAYYTKEQDGLFQRWMGSNWCNPPYSDPFPWVVKAVQELVKGNKTVMLLKTDVSTKFYRAIWEAPSTIWHINHRIKYEGATGPAEFSSMIAIFNGKCAAEAELVRFNKDTTITFIRRGEPT